LVFPTTTFLVRLLCPLEKYTDQRIGNIEDPKVLKAPPFDQYGTNTKLRRGIFSSV
jgi:hypothetical protein